MFLEIIMCIMPGDRTMLPLIKKNLESHSLKNMKANLMYSVTVCFLVFQATNFLSVGNYLIQMSHILFGADITLRWLLASEKIVLDEIKIRDLLDGHLEENGGKIKAYSLISGSVSSLMQTNGREKVSEYVIGPGLSENKNKNADVQFTGVKGDFLDSLNHELAFYPHSIEQKPFGP